MRIRTRHDTIKHISREYSIDSEQCIPMQGCVYSNTWAAPWQNVQKLGDMIQQRICLCVVRRSDNMSAGVSRSKHVSSYEQVWVYSSFSEIVYHIFGFHVTLIMTLSFSLGLGQRSGSNGYCWLCVLIMLAIIFNQSHKIYPKYAYMILGKTWLILKLCIVFLVSMLHC